MHIIRAGDTAEMSFFSGDVGHHFKVLTPHNRESGGLGVSLNRLPQGKVAVPFHWHAREDEAFYILSGQGIFRYGEQLSEVGPGDCISCPAGTKVAHQIGNPYAEDLVYLCMGPYDADEVCGYPDNGKLLVRAAGVVGRMEKRPYMDGEPEVPVLFALWEELQG